MTDNPLYAFLFFVLFSCSACAPGQSNAPNAPNTDDEMTRALSDVDHRNYQQAIDRLEALGASDSSLQSSDRYVDLITSAYLGRSGVDIVDVANQWIKDYQDLQSIAPPQSGDSAAAKAVLHPKLGLAKFRDVVNGLIPSSLGQDDASKSYFNKALAMCNTVIADSDRAQTVSKRILIKTMITNFWAMTLDLRDSVIPPLQDALVAANPSAACQSVSKVAGGLKDLTASGQNIVLAASYFANKQNSAAKAIVAFSDVSASLSWLQTYSTCDSISDDDIEKIKNELVHL